MYIYIYVCVWIYIRHRASAQGVPVPYGVVLVVVGFSCSLGTPNPPPPPLTDSLGTPWFDFLTPFFFGFFLVGFLRSNGAKMEPKWSQNPPKMGPKSMKSQ